MRKKCAILIHNYIYSVVKINKQYNYAHKTKNCTKLRNSPSFVRKSENRNNKADVTLSGKVPLGIQGSVSSKPFHLKSAMRYTHNHIRLHRFNIHLDMQQQKIQQHACAFKKLDQEVERNYWPALGISAQRTERNSNPSTPTSQW